MELSAESRNKSVSTRNKMCQSYVNKLNKQIQTIQEQARYFNKRNSRAQSAVKPNLKTLTEPKYQNILQQQWNNPESKKVELNTKISHLFKNSSTYTQFDFTANPLLMRGSTSTIVALEPEKKSAIQQKIQEKLENLRAGWEKVDSFRISNYIRSTDCHFRDRKTQSILLKIERRRPFTAEARNSFT